MLRVRSPGRTDASAAPIDARLLAGFLVSACRFIYLYAVRRLLAGELADDVYSDYVRVVNLAFDMLAGAARSAN